jgi:hypothetical protein
MLDAAIADRRFQLYYTGLTRVAHNILGEIVKGLFLNDTERIRTIDAIGLNADFAAEALQLAQGHGGVARLLGVCVDAVPELFLVTEPAAGGSLESLPELVDGMRRGEVIHAIIRPD